MRKIHFLFILIFIIISCTKKIAKNPELAYSDFALLDSINHTANNSYKNNVGTVYPNTGAPHGPFKLRFNAIGFTALTNNGKLPVGGVMPNGALIVKDIIDANNTTNLYAFMYKRAGSWIWGEITPNKQVLYGVNKNPSLCVNCHSQNINTDLIRTFQYY